MPIYKVTQELLEPVKEIEFKMEKDLQKLTEKNLGTIFDLEFVASEFCLHNLCIDTLAYDPANKAFIIVEYKKDKSSSVVDQGYAYLALMLNNKADFVLEYNEKKGHNLRKKDIDWSQSRVIFIARSFTPYQRNAINFKDLPIELWEARKFENNIVTYSQIKPLSSAESIKLISKSPEMAKVSREIKIYTVEEHLKNLSEPMREAFRTIREEVLNLDQNIVEKVGKVSTSYKLSRTFLYIWIARKKLAVAFSRGVDLVDSTRILRGRGKYERYIRFTSIEEFKNIKKIIIDLIEQAYRKEVSAPNKLG